MNNQNDFPRMFCVLGKVEDGRLILDPLTPLPAFLEGAIVEVRLTQMSNFPVDRLPASATTAGQGHHGMAGRIAQRKSKSWEELDEWPNPMFIVQADGKRTPPITTEPWTPERLHQLARELAVLLSITDIAEFKERITRFARVAVQARTRNRQAEYLREQGVKTEISLDRRVDDIVDDAYDYLIGAKR